MVEGTSERLQKILSAAGIASRRAAERLILEGRVAVNGSVVLALGTRADPRRDDIRVDGRRIPAPRRIYLLLNKPRGFVTTRFDPQGRPTVLDLVPEPRAYVYPVGRLDYDSEGLLLLTNDGELAAGLMHPRHRVERVYEAQVLGVPDQMDLGRLARGVVIDGRRTAPAIVRLRGRAPSSRQQDGHRRRAHGSSSLRSPSKQIVSPAHPDLATTVEITVCEGRSRQVRKMCLAIGHPVLRLRRVRIGPIADPSLKTGACRPLTIREVEMLKRSAGLVAKIRQSPPVP
jgi:pseudouridine synthase